MRPIGFSTGALAHADFRRGLAMTRAAGCPAVELSALRQPELFPMLDALDSLDLTGFQYISIHAPSQMTPEFEQAACERLLAERWRNWPIVIHPDAITAFALWRRFGSLLCVENMDKRKAIGRTARELNLIFQQLPEASLCFDIGHVRQVDPTMTESYLILRDHGARLRQVHISEVSTNNRHNRLSMLSIMAMPAAAHRIPADVPLIIESPVTQAEMADEIGRARRALPLEPVPLHEQGDARIDSCAVCHPGA
ncbi:MAG: hypothetical protein SFV51_30210 [Bryobacteraceae bacterium]|nr:hypothetical protein [Bryobacteraceae bacterium]